MASLIIDFVLKNLVSAPSHANEVSNQGLIPLLTKTFYFICKRDTPLIYANRKEGMIMLAADILCTSFNP